MARIAIAVGIGVAGALTGGLAAAGFGIFAGTFAGGSVLGGVLLGGSIGFSAGQLLGSVLLPPGINTSGPRLMDGQVSSSAEGSPIPFGYGGFRLGGQIIWSSGIQEAQSTTTQGGKGGPTQTQTTYSYTVSFAAAFCEGTAGITRIWGDSKLIYDATSKGSVTSTKLSTGIGDNTVNLYPAVYPGNATQDPDPTIQAAEGVDSTPAFRGICYLVYENFPLADFGNRLPNIRAEITSSAVDGFLKDIYPPSAVIDPNPAGSPAFEKPAWCYVDYVSRAAYIFDAIGFVVQRIDLSADNTGPLQPWQPDTAYGIGDQILGNNNSVQVIVSTTGDAHTGSGSEPTWTDTLFDVTSDHNVHWQNVGEGPEAVVVTNQGALDGAAAGLTVAANANMPTAAGVDTRGYLWMTISATPLQPVTNYRWRAAKFDPRTFNVLSSVALPGPVLSFQFVKTAQSDIVAFTTQENVTDGGKLYFADAKSGSASTGIQCFVSGTVDGVFPIALDSSGVAYVLTYDNATFTYKIFRCDPRGASAFSSFASNSTHGNPESLLWYQADNSLLLFTDTGYVIKIDVATMTVSATSASAIIYSADNYPQRFSSMYPAGQVPGDGIIRAQFENGSGVFQMAFIDARTLAVLSTVDLSSWITGITQPLQHHFYDPSSNSLVCTVSSSTGSPFSFRLYLDRQAVAGETLDGVVLNLLERGGLDSSDADLTALSSIIVTGYPIARNPDVKGALSPLTQAYFFDLVESDYKIKAVLRGGSASFSIPETDLGLLGDQYEVQPSFAQQHDLPKTLEVVYNDPALDYQQGKQQRQRNARVKKTVQKITLQLPLTLDENDAAQIAAKALQTLWDERDSFAFKLWRASYLAYDASDVGEFFYNGGAYAVRLSKTTMGQDLTLEIAAVSEDARNYNSTIKGAPSPGFVPQIVNPLPPTILFLFDVPLLQDIDASPSGSSGFYYAMTAAGKGWPAGVLYASSDGSTWNQVGFSNNAIPFGGASMALAAPADPQIWDDVNTITVYMVGTALSSATDIAVLNGANAAILGNEVLQFGKATLNDGGSYTLSHLLRGRRGTEWACLHLPGETFVLLSSGLHRNFSPTTQIGKTIEYKAVTVGGVTTAAQSTDLTLAGNDLKPYSPCSIKGARNTQADIDITWVRRTRIGGAWLDGNGEVPLAEDFEQYDVEIMKIGVVGTPGVTLSPNPVLVPYTLFDSPTYVNTERVAPFTATFADGHTADYPGFDFGLLGSPDGYVTVYDPDQQGGSGLTYNIESTPTLANLPGYIYLGRIVFTSGAFNPFSAETGGSDVVARTAASLPSPEFFYTADEQTTDFGSAQSAIRVRVYQISAQVGRGFPAEAII